MKIRLLELCAGYGSQALALKNLGLDVYSEISEIDKYASQAYMQIHGKTKNYGDIYAIDETKLPYFDMITYSTPCQDFSVAGKGKGGDRGSGTRSSLLWECERIIRAVKPKYLLMENVKNLLSDKHRHNFNEWFKVLEEMGYTNYYKILNAKDYGVPQNRERVFCVSILGGGQYLFPNPIPLEKRLKDVLETYVDEKYYLSADKVAKFSKLFENFATSYYLDANYWKGTIIQSYLKKHRRQLVKEISNTICCSGGGSLDGKHTWDIVVEPQVLTPKRTEYGKQIRKNYEAGLISESRHNMTDMQPRTDGVANTLTSVQKDNYVVEPKITEGNRIRKLTPRECFRLMGVKDEQFNQLHGISNTQLYKLAGNSIVVDVLMAIFNNLFLSDNETKGQLTLF